MTAVTWKLPRQVLTIGPKPLIMGIVNATPDSFSDGGKYDPVAQGLKLINDGADILDIGGESTRPGAMMVSEDEELRRVIPVIIQLSHQASIPLSIDTTKARVAREAVATGASIINDISALEADADMVQVAVDSGAAIVAMHRQGTPQTMQQNPHYDNVVNEVSDYLKLRLSHLEKAGIARERIVLDPGIGFGKRTEHNLALLAHLDRLTETGRPVLLGVSRKGFIHRTLEREPNTFAGDMGTMGLMLHAHSRGWLHVARVHNVDALRIALDMWQAVDNRVLSAES
ncbi:MAG: dihydropteroate synthase [Gemmatales bacterium]